MRNLSRDLILIVPVFRHWQRQLYGGTASFHLSFGHRAGDGVAITRPLTTRADRPIKERKRKGRAHPRNAFQGTYDMDRLVAAYPTLGPHVVLGPTGRPTVKFADPAAVRALNTALLVADYGVNPDYADLVPPHALVPPVPGRADYVHHMADALQKSLAGGDDDDDALVPKGSVITGMDIGTGASCIYPTIATSVYGWKMIASDINHASVTSAREIVKANGHSDLIDVRHQEVSDKSIFDGILRSGESIDFTMCNPPFYPSREAFQAESARKVRGLSKGKVTPQEVDPTKSCQLEGERASSNNFGGTDSELWCEGGEVAFVKRIISESKQYWNRCLWFTSLVSRHKNLKKIENGLFSMGKQSNKGNNKQVQVVQRVAMGAGVKSSTILMWSFLDERERRDWARRRNWR